MQIHNAPAPPCPNERVLPALVLLVLHIHLSHVLSIFLVLVFIVGADDGGSEPEDGAELHGGVVEEFLFGFVLLVGCFGHVGMAVLESADGIGCQGGFDEGGHGWMGQPTGRGRSWTKKAMVLRMDVVMVVRSMLWCERF